MAKNIVIAGEYQGKGVGVSFGLPFINTKITKPLYLDKGTVESYEVITEETRKSAASGIARGIVGGALLGPVGLLAGGLYAKNKGTVTLAIQFKDGGKSLIEADDKFYKALMQQMF